MPGQCYGCGVEFGLFKKEHGCKNCGFAFCSKCLADKTIAIPKRNNSKHHACTKCFKILSGETEKQPVTYDLPQAYLKRVEALKDRESASSKTTSSSQRNTIPTHLRNLAKPDREIAQRLEKLREADKTKDKVTDKDISSRLALLKDQTVIPDSKPPYKPPDRRLQPKQVDDLLDEIASEVEIDSHRPNPAQEVEARLARLRSDDAQKTKNDNTGHMKNDLDKVSPGKSSQQHYKNNIGFAGDVNSEETSLADIERLMAATAKELEEDAGREMGELMKDKELMDRLKKVQKKRDERDGKPITSDIDTNSPQAGSTAETSQELEDTDSSDGDDDMETRRIIQRYLAEVKLDENVEKDLENNTSKTANQVEPGFPNLKPPTLEEFDDELPFCCICEDDASLRCLGCEMDIFCQRCFRECHSDMGISDHRSVPYQAPKGYS